MINFTIEEKIILSYFRTTDKENLVKTLDKKFTSTDDFIAKILINLLMKLEMIADDEFINLMEEVHLVDF